MDITYNYTYKNATIELIVEDDLITTGKAYVDGSNISIREFSTERNADGLPNKPNYIEKALGVMKADVDENWSKEFSIEIA